MGDKGTLQARLQGPAQLCRPVPPLLAATEPGCALRGHRELQAILLGSASCFSLRISQTISPKSPLPLPPLFQESLGLSDPGAGHTDHIPGLISACPGQTHTKSDHSASCPSKHPCGKLRLEDPPARPPSRVRSIQTHKTPRQELGSETSQLINTSILRAGNFLGSFPLQAGSCLNAPRPPSQGSAERLNLEFSGRKKVWKERQISRTASSRDEGCAGQISCLPPPPSTGSAGSHPTGWDGMGKV